MSRLNPDLKRLMTWARQAPQQPPAEMPLGFSTRTVSRWVEENGMFAILQRVVWRSAWAAAVLILLGLALFGAQKYSANSPYDLGPAYQVVATEFVP